MVAVRAAAKLQGDQGETKAATQVHHNITWAQDSSDPAFLTLVRAGPIRGCHCLLAILQPQRPSLSFPLFATNYSLNQNTKGGEKYSARYEIKVLAVVDF